MEIAAVLLLPRRLAAGRMKIFFPFREKENVQSSKHCKKYPLQLRYLWYNSQKVPYYDRLEEDDQMKDEGKRPLRSTWLRWDRAICMKLLATLLVFALTAPLCSMMFVYASDTEQQDAAELPTNIYKALAINAWTWEGYGKRGTDAAIGICIDEIQTKDAFIAALKKRLPQRIYGWSSGTNKMTAEGPWTPDKIDASGKNTWGYLTVDWNGLDAQFANIDWTQGFEIYADIPTFW